MLRRPAPVTARLVTGPLWRDVYRVYTVMREDRWTLDLEALDQNDPFEIDADNRPHLAKRLPYTEDDAYDVFFGDPIFVDAPHEPALWLMIGPVPGDMLIIPLAPAKRDDQVRPIGIYRAGRKHQELYESND